MWMKTIAVLLAVSVMCSVCSAAGNPCLDYTPLSDAARASGQLARYDHAAEQEGKAALTDATLKVSLPRQARAYDVIPIRFKLAQPGGNRRVAIEAVTFEDHAKAGDRPLCDLAIPGNMNVAITYLGSIAAAYKHDQYIPLTSDPKTPISPFPPFQREPFVCSSTIRPADVMWFKFRLTNTGDTILDPEGFGASFAEPWLDKLNPNGSIQWRAQPVNLYDRQLMYLYPGESTEIWLNFFCPKGGGYGLQEGSYRSSSAWCAGSMTSTIGA
jgi:hypothetical protein